MSNGEFGSLPEGYFDGKDASKYRFYVFDDIVHADGAKPIPYNSSHEQRIVDIYKDQESVAIYVHIPWCECRCTYCYYHQARVKDEQTLRDLVQAEQQHAAMLEDKIDLRSKKVPTIYFGGGTPTILPDDLLDEHLSFYVDRYAQDGCEICCEASPYTLTPTKLDVLEEHVTRFSVGIQSFDGKLLKAVGRGPIDESIEKLLVDAIARLPTVNLDLIYGLPGQTRKHWIESVHKAIELGAPSITTYRLEIRQDTPINKQYRKHPELFPDEPTCWTMCIEAKDALLEAGYKENLVGWFLLPNVADTVVYRERWEHQTPCVAFGPRVHNYGADHFYDTLESHEAYVAAIAAGELPIEHVYTVSDKKKLIWYVLAQWKSNKPAYKEELRKRFGDQLSKWFLGLIQNYVSWDMLVETSDVIEMTESARLALDWVLGDIINAGLT